MSGARDARGPRPAQRADDPRGAADPASRRVRLALAACALAIPLLAAPAAGRMLADALAIRGGAALAGAAAQLEAITPARPPAGAEAAPTLEADPAADAAPGAPASSAAAAPCPPGARGAACGAPAPAPTPKGLRIRAAVVARAVRSGARPSGTPVPPSGARPAGLALHGIGHLGAGLRDGDVLTSVAGAPASSPDVVVGAVMGALRARAEVLSATVWRGDAPIQVAVELPRARL